MAAVLESFVVPRSSALPSSTFPSLASSPVCSLSGRRGSARLPEFSGLKVQLSLTSRSVASVGRSSRVGRRVGGVVCEAQDTAVEEESSSTINFSSTINLTLSNFKGRISPRPSIRVTALTLTAFFVYLLALRKTT